MRDVLLCDIHPNIGCSLVNLYIAYTQQHLYKKVVINPSFNMDLPTFFRYFSFDLSCIGNLSLESIVDASELQMVYKKKALHQDINYDYTHNIDVIFEPSFKHSINSFSLFFNKFITVNYNLINCYLDAIYNTNYEYGVFMQLFNTKCISLFLKDYTYRHKFFNCCLYLNKYIYIDIDNIGSLRKYYDISNENITLDAIVDFPYISSYDENVLQESVFYSLYSDNVATEKLITQFLLSALVMNRCKRRFVTKTTFPMYVLPNIKVKD